MRRKIRKTGGVMVVILVGWFSWTCGMALGEEPKPNPFAQQIASANEIAQRIRNDYQQLANDLEQFDGFVKDDLVKAKDAYEAEALAFEKAGEAWKRNEPAQADQFWKQGSEADPAKTAWWRRLWISRRLQADCAPTEQWYCEELRRVRPGALPAFHAWVAAKKAASETWGAVAEATLPGVDPRRIEEMERQATAVRSGVEIMQWRYMWANGVEEWSQDGRLNGDAVKPQFDALLRAQDERAKLQQDRIDLEQRVHDADVHMMDAQRDLQTAYYKEAVRRQQAGK